ncbi:unnamed protein product [Mytilus edulis]|uniref:CCHC-type domain-containing protein n=1 Tax=Mytilus edulis TaxID=6550 RepID=A0A8S3U155_MYTED|nr:unnamed protein product [Mytilus edulis]
MAANTQQTDDELSGNLLYDKDAKVILMEILKSLRVLTDRIEKIEKEVQKIDGIKEGLSNLSTRVQTNEETIVEIQDRNSKVEESVEKMGQIVHTIVDKYSANAEEISQIKDRMETIGEDNGTSSNIAIKELKADMLDLKCRSMSDNLVFSGLAFQREESCQLKIQNFLLNELDIPYKVNLGSVHRFGKPGLNGARPIVAKFIHRDELEDVLKNTFKLKGKQFGISEQFPIEIERKRKELYPVMKKAKKEGKKVKLVRDKLYINGKPHVSLDTKPNGTEYRDVLLRQAQQNSYRNKTVNERPFKRSRQESGNNDAINEETITTPINKIGKRRSGGLAVAYKNHLKDNIEYIKTESKFVLWCKISKVINRLDDILLGIIYIPPEYTSYSSIDAINEIEMELFELSHKFSKCLLVGDFNARTGSEDDFIFVPDSESHVVDIENIQINAVCNLDQYDFSRKRNSRDKNKNRFGNQLLEFCKGNNFFIMNGRTLGDIDGKCSFPNRDILETNRSRSQHKMDDDTRTNEQKINNWTNEKSYKFLECLNLTEIENINSEIDGTTVVTQETVDMIISKIGKVLINSAGNTFGFKVSAGKKSEHRKNKPWFDHDCKAARSEFRKMKRNKNKSPFHRALVSDAEKRYKNTMNKAHKKYRSDFRKKMDDLKQKDAKEFWRLLNENKSTAQPKIDFDKLESSDPSDLVKPIFLKDQDVHGSEKPPRAQWLTNVEIFKSISAKVPKQCIKGIQRIREMWRIYMDNEGDRLSLLVQGLNLRGRQVPLHSQNPHNPSTLQKDTIRIKVKNIPLSADDGQIHRALTLQGCEIQGLFREYLRVDGRMTACETGDRLVISKTLDKPIPRNLPIGRYFGRIFHAGQPEFQNNNNSEREERTCHKCLKPGHMLFQCPNDWVCKTCKKGVTKMLDCPQNFQTVDEHDHDESRQQPENDNIASVDNTDQDENVDHTELEVPTIPPAKKQSGKNPITSKHLLARQLHQKEIKMEIVTM